MRYKLIDHTADFGIHVNGSDQKALFANAALAMFDLITDARSLKGERSTTIIVSGGDWSDLMVNWLRELLYLWTGKKYLVQAVDIVLISEDKIAAKVILDSYDPDQHHIRNEIKAVTYHQIQVENTPDGWESKIIFDV